MTQNSLQTASSLSGGEDFLQLISGHTTVSSMEQLQQFELDLACATTCALRLLQYLVQQAGASMSANLCYAAPNKLHILTYLLETAQCSWEADRLVRSSMLTDDGWNVQALVMESRSWTCAWPTWSTLHTGSVSRFAELRWN